MGTTAAIAVVGALVAKNNVVDPANDAKKAAKNMRDRAVKQQEEVEFQTKLNDKKDEATALRDQMRARQKSEAAGAGGRQSTILTADLGSAGAAPYAVTGGGQKTLLGV